MTRVSDDISLDLGALRTAYDRGSLTPTTVVDVVLRRIADRGGRWSVDLSCSGQSGNGTCPGAGGSG